MTESMIERHSFVLQLEYGVLRELCQKLDVESKWRDLVAAADGTRFQLQDFEVEECARALHSGGSPTEKLLKRWGNSMRLHQFTALLDQLRLERCMLSIRGPEKLAITLQPECYVQLLEGETLRLNCEAVGFPYPVFTWFFGKDKILSMGSSGTLEVNNVSLQNAGLYVCRVHHINHQSKVADCLFSGWCEVKVVPSKILAHEKACQAAASSVQQGPQICQQPADVSSEVGGVALFRVDAVCNSEISYQWYFHSEDGRHSNSIQGATESELRVNIDGKYNAGKYQCRVRAAQGEDVLTQLAQLTVTGDRRTYKAADKIALFIGVSKYQNHKVQLPAVEHDLQASVKVFEKMDFKVISLLNLTLDEMRDAIELFCKLLSEDVYAVFYCAGHGFRGPDRQHYLIPCDASSDLVPSESLCIETVEASIQQRKPKLLMFFLDICRQSNSSAEHSLKVQQSAKAVPNKIIIYAASEGQQAYEQNQKQESVPRGLFNKYLLEVIDKPLSATDLYKAIIDKFKVLPYSREKYPQFPEMVTNNEDYERKLVDPIDMELYGRRIAVQTSLWCLAHVLPQVPPAKIFPKNPDVFQIHFAFERVLSNVMEMKVIAELEHDWKNKIEVVEVSVSPGDVRRVMVPSPENNGNMIAYFTFSDLQRVRTNLVVHLRLACRLMVSGQHPKLFATTIPLDLGRPLIAVNNLRHPSDLESVSCHSTSDNNLSTCALPDVPFGEKFEANVPLNSSSSCDNLDSDGRPDDLSSVSTVTSN